MEAFLDPRLPGLATAFQPHAVIDLLRRRLPECGNGLDIFDGEILSAQYKPGSYCRFLYRFSWRNRHGEGGGDQLFSARALRADEDPPATSETLLARYKTFWERGGGNEERGLSAPVVYLPEARLVLYSYPLDTSLPGIFDALDATAMTEWLNRLWAERDGQVHEVKIEPLRYTPQMRFTARYDVLSEARGSTGTEWRRLVGKITAYRAPAPILFADAWALCRTASEGVRFAPPTGYITSLDLMLQEHVAGTSLSELAGSDAFLGAARRAGQAIVAVHQASPPITRHYKPHKHARLVHQWADLLSGLVPEQAARIERLRDAVAAELEDRVRMTGLMHGDFHPANVLADGDEIVLIDLDDMAYGDTLADIGQFMASLRTPALRLYDDPTRFADVGEAFLGEYLARVPEDESRVRLFEAAHLLHSAAFPFRIQRPNWRQEAASLIEEAERTFRRAAKPTAGVVGKGPERFELGLEDRLRWSGDPVYMRASLAHAVQDTYGAEITQCGLSTRQPTAASSPVRYDLTGWRGTASWCRTVEGHMRTRRVRRLNALDEALVDRAGAPLLPKVVTYLSALSMVVLDPPQGAPLVSQLGGPQALETVEALARALATLQEVKPDLRRAKSLDDEFDSARRRVERLTPRKPALAARAARVLAEAEKRIRTQPERFAPTLYRLAPKYVHVADGRIAFAGVVNVVLADPAIGAASFLVRLVALGRAHDGTHGAALVAARFREAYVAASDTDAGRLAAFEAFVAVPLACASIRKTDEDDRAERLIRHAEGLLGISETKGPALAENRRAECESEQPPGGDRVLKV